MFSEKEGYEIYSGKRHADIRKLRSGENVKNSYDKKRAIEANHKLMKEFKSMSFVIPKGIPHNIRYVYRGQGSEFLKIVKIKGTSFFKASSRSYISFSKKISVARNFAQKHKNSKILQLNLKSIDIKVPIIYNKLWGFKSSIRPEEEVLLPPGNLIFDMEHVAETRIGKKTKIIGIYRIVSYVPYKNAKNLKTGMISPYSK